MPVFYNDDLCYLHIPKCGGLSVTAAARGNLPGYTEPGVKRKWLEPGKPIGHIRAADFERFVGRSLNTFELVFATIRPPIDCEWSKWNFWRNRYYRDGRCVAWRHPADAWCWQHTFAEYIERGVEPFNDWYAEKIAPWSATDYNITGRFNWWLADNVKRVDIKNEDRINEILSKYCGKQIKLDHLHRTGAGPPSCGPETQKQIEAQYGIDEVAVTAVD